MRGLGTSGPGGEREEGRGPRLMVRAAGETCASVTSAWNSAASAEHVTACVDSLYPSCLCVVFVRYRGLSTPYRM